MKYYTILLAILLTSCTNDLKRLLQIHEWKTYTIEAGEHYSNGYKTRINTLSTDHIDFIATFNETAVYNTQDKSNQTDINKLYGFADCNSKIDQFSARFGWVWNPKRNKLECWAYVYAELNRHFKYMGDINFNEEMTYSIYCVSDHYDFNFNGNLVKMPRGCSQQMVVRFYAYPYFGGDETAPHQVQIKIKE